MYKNLIFKGGGIKGIGYIEAIDELQKYLHLSDIERVGGTSAGAITALLISLGFSTKEMQTMMSGFDYKKFMDEDSSFHVRDKLLKAAAKPPADSSFFSSCIPACSAASPISPVVTSRLFNGLGIFEGKAFLEWTQNCISLSTRDPNLTFGELHKLKLKDPRFKDLYVVGVNLNTSLPEVFSYETHPDVVIAHAIRISMSIPYVFKPHLLFRKTASGEIIPDVKGHLYVDGGLVANYPIDIFDKIKYVDPASPVPDAKIFNEQTLGFSLVCKEQKDFLTSIAFPGGTLEEERPDAPLHYKEIKSITTLTKALLYSIYEQEEHNHVRSGDPVRTIYIDTCGVGTLEFDIPPEKKDAILRSGREAVTDYFRHLQNRPTTLT